MVHYNVLYEWEDGSKLTIKVNESGDVIDNSYKHGPTEKTFHLDNVMLKLWCNNKGLNPRQGGAQDTGTGGGSWSNVKQVDIDNPPLDMVKASNETKVIGIGGSEKGCMVLMLKDAAPPELYIQNSGKEIAKLSEKQCARLNVFILDSFEFWDTSGETVPEDVSKVTRQTEDGARIEALSDESFNNFVQSLIHRLPPSGRKHSSGKKRSRKESLIFNVKRFKGRGCVPRNKRARVMVPGAGLEPARS